MAQECNFKRQPVVYSRGRRELREEAQPGVYLRLRGNEVEERYGKGGACSLHAELDTLHCAGNPMPSNFYAVASVPYGDGFAIVGGKRGARKEGPALLYNPSNDSWTLGPSASLSGNAYTYLHKTVALPVRPDMFAKCGNKTS